MSYELIPKDKKAESISFGAFTWPILLQETGMGYIIGYGQNRQPSGYVYWPRKNGASPVSNDGYPITSAEAKMMARIARGFISVHRFIQKEWDALPEKEREIQLNYLSHNGGRLYKAAWHENRLKQLEAFAEFAEKSKGFSIH